MTIDLEEIRTILAISNDFPQHYDTQDIEVPIHVTIRDITVFQDAFQALEMLEKNSAKYVKWQGDMEQMKYCMRYARIAEVYAYKMEQLKDLWTPKK